MVPIGAVFAGKYRVERVLGQGGMGVVVQATHLQLNQPVAIKFLLPEVMTSEQVVQRFLREAQAAVRLRSEHVARVIDVGALDNGAPYMVLEYLDGMDLSALQRQQLTVGQIVDLMLQACEALAEAHSIGIVHRDIKPANFFITRGTDGSALLKVLDFGISKARDPDPSANNNLTATSMVMGTPAYMSPEQIKSARNVDLRGDIWSLGIVLYELFQGLPPFQADTFGLMAVKVVTEPLPPLTNQLPPGLAQVVYRCLEKDPANRFQNVAELSAALAPYALSTAQAAIAVERTSRVLGTEPPKSTSMLTNGARTIPPTAGRRWPIFVALSSVVAIATIAIIVVATRSDKSGGTSPPAPDAAIAMPATPDAAPLIPKPAPDAAIVVAAPVDAAVPIDAAVAATITPDAAVVVTTVKPPKPPKPPGDGKPPKPPGDGKPPKPPGDGKPPPTNGSDDVLGTRQ